ncbi:hypothetical protein KR026_009480, partial [Drosophila bipectinata]
LSHNMSQKKEERKARWYFGGLGSVGAAMVTHPLDLIKVTQQTQQGKLSIIQIVPQIAREHGVLAFYNGLSASMLRQMTYSTTRFGAYEVGKNYINTDTFGGKVLLAGLSGFAGGIIGTPADMVNVRMQNDVKLPPDQRRNYKHAIDGFAQIIKNEGAITLFSGWTLVAARGTLMTLGQNFCYDLVKKYMLSTPHFKDNVVTHFTSSLVAAAVSTTLTQPLDVIKTRRMNAKPGKYRNMLHIIHHTAKLGPLGFYKGFVPAFLRLGPYTVLLFVFMEQLRLYFGYIPVDKEEDHTS